MIKISIDLKLVNYFLVVTRVILKLDRQVSMKMLADDPENRYYQEFIVESEIRKKKLIREMCRWN